MRKAIERLYKGKCTIYVKCPVEDPNTKITRFEEQAVLVDEPCRLSFSNIPVTENGVVAGIKQVTKLFISPNVEIPPGSKIEVTQEGRTTLHQRSGEPAVYGSHQEIMLEKFERYA